MKDPKEYTTKDLIRIVTTIRTNDYRAIAWLDRCREELKTRKLEEVYR
jgi:hypothetical protein